MRVVKINIPPDKSISQRAVMLASISKGLTHIKNLLVAEDIRRTIDAFRAMGVDILFDNNQSLDVTVHGVGLRGLTRPSRPLYLGNSGTTMRLLPGILAGQSFNVVLKGDRSLSKRPMKRIVEPLRKMGARISGRQSMEEIFPPLNIHGGKLKPIKYKSKVASAQVKSCILLAGLYADGLTSVTEAVKSRDHTERMLKQFGADIRIKGRRVTIRNEDRILRSPAEIEVHGDISSAAFFIVAGCILPDTKVIIKNVGLNPTRTGVLDILKRMGADIRVTSHKSRVTSHEPSGDIVVKSSRLRGIKIGPKEVVRAIDEIPIIMVASCFAKGKTVIRGVGELRVKETDRIKSMVTNLRKMGAEIFPLTLSSPHGGEGKGEGDTVAIHGTRPLHGARVSSYGDHRTAMSMLVAGLACKGKVNVTGLVCIDKSFPQFMKVLREFTRERRKAPCFI